MNLIVRLITLHAILLLTGQTVLCQTAVTGATDLWDLAQKH
jgi:hypothetical protein